MDGEQVGPGVAEDRESKMFPEPSGARGTQDVITCHTLTTDFLVYGSDMGAITYFLLEDWCIISEFRRSAGIKELVADPNGTKVLTQNFCNLTITITNTFFLSDPFLNGHVSILIFVLT